jgi:hypothetical protein
MSYSFDVSAASKSEAREKVAAYLDEIVKTQPLNFSCN